MCLNGVADLGVQMPAVLAGADEPVMRAECSQGEGKTGVGDGQLVPISLCLP